MADSRAAGTTNEGSSARLARRIAYRVAGRMGYDLVRKQDNPHAHLERHVRQILLRLSVNCVLDVGANAGQYAERLRAAGYSGRILSFEPSAASFARLQDACRDDPQWTCHELALGDESGLGRMYRARSSLLTSFLPLNRGAQDAFAEAAEVDGEEQVRVERLDELFAELVAGIEEPRVFLKMDTQGYDLRVFAGARACLPRICGLQSELSVVPLYDGMPDFLQALRVYRSSGFEVTGFFPIFRHEPDLVIGEFDCVMVRLGSAGSRTTRLTVPLR